MAQTEEKKVKVRLVPFERKPYHKDVQGVWRHNSRNF